MSKILKQKNATFATKMLQKRYSCKRSLFLLLVSIEDQHVKIVTLNLTDKIPVIVQPKRSLHPLITAIYMDFHLPVPFPYDFGYRSWVLSTTQVWDSEKKN